MATSDNDLDQLLKEYLKTGQKTAPAAAPETPAVAAAATVAAAPAPATLVASAPTPVWAVVLTTVSVCALVMSVILFFSSRSDRDDDVVPDAVVIKHYDGAMTSFAAQLGQNVQAVGKRMSPGDVDTVNEWVVEMRKAFTEAHDQFIKETGEMDQKYVPEESGEIPASSLRNFSNYTIAAGKGVEQAVSK